MSGLKKIPTWLSGIKSTSKADEWFKNYTPAEQEMFLSLSQNRGAPKKDIERNVFSDYDVFTEKMTTPLDSGLTTDEILKQDYTGKVPTKKPKAPYSFKKEEFIGPKEEKVVVAKGHVAQKDVRPNQINPGSINKDTYDIIKQVSDEDGFITPKSEITGAQSKIASLDDVDDYVKYGKERFEKSHLPGSLKIHGDFIVPPEYRYMVDFTETFPYYTQAGKETKFSKHHQGFLTNVIRNESYHKHYEGLLYRWLTEQKLIKKAFKDGKIKKAQYDKDMKYAKDYVDKIREDMKKLGLETKVWNKNKNGFDTYGQRYGDKQLSTLYQDQKKSYKLNIPPRSAGNLTESEFIKAKANKTPGVKPPGHEEGGFVRQNMSYGGDTSQYSSKDAEDYVQLAMLKGNPFKLKKPPEIVTDFDTNIKITDQGPGTTKIKETEQLKIGPADQKSIFYLKSDEVLANATQNKMQPSQWLGYLQKNGVSPTELDEFGLQNVIYNLGDYNPSTKKFNNNKAISKNDLITAYKKEKPVLSYQINQVEPFEKGLKDFRLFIGHSDRYSNQTDIEKIRSLKNKPADLGGNDLRVKLSAILDNSEYKSWDDMSKDIEFVINDTYKKYYGIDNVTKNGVGNEVVPFYSKNILDRFKRLKGGEGFYFSKNNVRHSGAQFLPGGTGYIEIPFTYNPQKNSKRASEPKYTYGEGHFTNTEGNNPVFWLRASERVDESGRRLLFIEEIQSDMHQKIKQNPGTFSYAKRHDSPGMINSNMVLDQINNLKVELGKVTDQIDKITGHTDPSATTIMERLKVKRESIRNQITELSNSIQDAAKRDDSVFPEGPFKKSENQAKVALKTAINLAKKEGFDGVAIITGKAKNAGANASGKNAKGNLGFYDNIASKAAKNVAKNLDLDFSATNIKDGNGNTWAKIPLIELNKLTETKPTDMYKNTGGYIHYPSFVDVVSPL